MIELLVVAAVVGLVGFLVYKDHKDAKEVKFEVPEFPKVTEITKTSTEVEEYLRTRDELGRFLPDDKETVDVNEAWIGGVSPAGKKTTDSVVVDNTVTDPEPETKKVVKRKQPNMKVVKNKKKK